MANCAPIFHLRLLCCSSTLFCSMMLICELLYTVWQYKSWSFQTVATKSETFLPKNRHTQSELLNFENWVNGEVSKSAKIWLSKLIFYVKNYPNLSKNFSLKDINFYITLFSKMMPNFWHFPINPILKIQ